MNELAKRDAILAIEQEIAKLPQIEFETKNYFCDGLYAREIHIPAGCILTGKIHKTRHLYSVTKGRIAVESEFGGGILEAGHTGVSEPGVKRIGYALEDTIFVTYHVTEETDVPTLEKTLVCDTYDEYALTHQPEAALCHLQH